MEEFIEVSGKTVEEALTEASIQLGTTSDQIEYEVMDKGSSGFLGIGNKPATIRARKKSAEAVNETVSANSNGNASIEEVAENFLMSVMNNMNLKVTLEISRDPEDNSLNINMVGDNMGILIGKRGQTLDNLQYLTSLVLNKNSEEYVRVKLDTENYRQRRKETLENLAKNISFKVKRTKRPVKLEPMNPFERRVIHYALQDDKYVTTHSEGEEPYRYIVVTPKK